MKLKLQIFLFVYLNVFEGILADWVQIDTSFTSLSFSSSDDWKMFQDCYSPNNEKNFNIDQCDNSINQMNYASLAQNREYMRKIFNFKKFQVRVIFDYLYINASSTDTLFQVRYFKLSPFTSISIFDDKYKSGDPHQMSNNICITESTIPFDYYTKVSTIITSDDNFAIVFCFIPVGQLNLGIRNILVYVNLCYPTCKSCTGKAFNQCDGCFDNQTPSGGKCTCIANQQFAEKCNKCDEQNGWYLQDEKCITICGDQKLQKLAEVCDDGNNDPYDGCNQCLYSCDANCQLCYYGRCSICDSGYILQKYTNNCIPYCGDGILINYTEQCDDGNNMQYDGCYQCEIACQSSCTSCSRFGCSECNTQGWELNQINNKCQTICGDGIIVDEYEECDDLISERCKDCKFQCSDGCKNCVKGGCYKCKSGWFLNADGQCLAIHGDSKVVNTEECDDWNQIDYDGCYLGKYQCQQSCLLCDKGLCNQCYYGYYNLNGKCQEIINDDYLRGFEVCDDNNLNPMDGCHSGKYDCPKNCSICLKGICLECLKSSGYGYLDKYNNVCKLICGDGIKTMEEDCDDGNTTPYDGCYLCKFQCDFDCEICDEGICQQCNYGFYLNKKKNQCLSFCGDGIITRFEYCDDANKIVNDGCADCKFKCHQQCVNCVDGKCFGCSGTGWQLNFVTFDCQPICGDSMVIGNEQCDDGNDIEEDGCYECYFDCQKVCTICDRGYCQECNTFGWELIWNRCYPICGDQQVIGYEECDDGNLIPFDGCFECKYQCQEACTDCQKGVCYECNTKGWDIKDNQCFAKCGDGYVVEGQEECDDGNNLQFDGCYKCYYQCEEKCTQCEKGICYECNELGWIIENHICLPFCGDGITVGYEQCDDMNDDFNDGCYKCMYACDQYCQVCQQGVCLECELGRFVYQNICLAQCGDGYFVKSVEGCDDSNLESGDGCDKFCQVEKDWSCINYEGQFSTCFYSVPPEFELELLTKVPEDFENVLMTFNQKVKLSNSFSGALDNSIISEITNLKTDEYSIITNIQKQITNSEVSDLVIEFKINFYVPVDEPSFKIKFKNDPISSEYDIKMQKTEANLKLITPMVLSEAQKDVAQSAQVFNKAVIYSLVGVSALCLLSGSSETFWNLMDQLQYLSYIKYININFPNNLNMYYDVFKLITVSPLMQFFGIDKFFDALDGDTQYVVETEYKFQKDEINGYFFLNFQSFLFCIMSAYTGYWATKYTYLALYRLGPYHISRLPFFVGKLIYSTRRQLKEKAGQFYLNGIIRILMSNTYDLSFACAIQMAYYPKEGSFTLLFNYYLSVIVYFLYFGTTIYTINILSNFSKQSSLKTKSSYEALFDGLQSTSDVWKIQHNAVQMIKKQLFISLIVFMQNDGQIQTLCIAFIQSMFLSYLLITKPLTNECEYFKNIVTETLIIFNTITFLFYAYRVEIALTLEGMINLGWIHILTSTMILGVSLVLDLYQQFQLLLNKIRSAFFKPAIDQTDSIQLFF